MGPTQLGNRSQHPILQDTGRKASTFASGDSWEHNKACCLLGLRSAILVVSYCWRMSKPDKNDPGLFELRRVPSLEQSLIAHN